MYYEARFVLAGDVDVQLTPENLSSIAPSLPTVKDQI